MDDFFEKFLRFAYIQVVVCVLVRLFQPDWSEEHPVHAVMFATALAAFVFEVVTGVLWAAARRHSGDRESQ